MNRARVIALGFAFWEVACQAERLSIEAESLTMTITNYHDSIKEIKTIKQNRGVVPPNFYKKNKRRY